MIDIILITSVVYFIVLITAYPTGSFARWGIKTFGGYAKFLFRLMGIWVIAMVIEIIIGGVCHNF